MIGFYVHHHGHGHLHRALAIQAVAETEIVGLSTLPMPAGWRGHWIRLADDAAPPVSSVDGDHTAGGNLHFVPTGHPGLRSRMAEIASWIDHHRPSAMVVDVSVEVALLARLHGVPVISMALPGVRTDAPHHLGYAVSDRILAPWPAVAARCWQVDGTDRAKVVEVGAISRFAPTAPRLVPAERQVLVLNGTGGGGPTPQLVAEARRNTPGWTWVHLDRAAGTWSDNPWPMMTAATVIVSHCGQNAVAEIAAARRPAILMPQSRPFDEQRATATALSGIADVPATVLDGWPAAHEWPALLDAAAAKDGAGWAVWNDGGGAARAAALIDEFDELLGGSETGMSA